MLTTTYKLIHEDGVLIAQPILIHHYGRVGASLIQQIYYWSQKGQGVIHNNQRWIHNTAEQWAEQLCVSARTIKRTVQKLIEDGAIRVQKLAKHKSNQTNSYTLNHERLRELMDKREGKAESTKKLDKICKINIVCETRKKTHRDILSPSSGQIVPMVIQRLTNKDRTNKSSFASTGGELNKIQQVQAQPMASSKLTASEYIQSSDGLEKGKERSSTAQNMVDIWNNEVSTKKELNKNKLNRCISKYLVASFKYRFNEDLDAWRQYCRLIASSPYLMGNGFALSLTWVLKFTTIDRILAGELGVQGLRPVSEHVKSEETLRAEALRHVEGVGESDGCKSVRRDILRAVGPTNYNAWFTKVDVLDDGKILRPHNRFVEAAIQARFGDVLERVK